MSGHYHSPFAPGQNTGNSLGNRSCVRQSKLFRMYESGNDVKSLLGTSNLCWDTTKKQGAYEGHELFDHLKPLPSTQSSTNPDSRSQLRYVAGTKLESKNFVGAPYARSFYQVETDLPSTLYGNDEDRRLFKRESQYLQFQRIQEQLDKPIKESCSHNNPYTPSIIANPLSVNWGASTTLAERGRLSLDSTTGSTMMKQQSSLVPSSTVVYNQHQRKTNIW
jgi:hypothetical protein